MSVVAEVEGRELLAEGEVFQGRCQYCGWESGQYENRGFASVIAALHECSPLVDRCVNCGYEVIEDGHLYHVENGMRACPSNDEFDAELGDLADAPEEFSYFA